MQYIIDLITNKIFLAPILAWVLAQIIKIVIDCSKGCMNKERLVEGGGMPSSHAATVTALIVITAVLIGIGSFEFAMAFIFGVIVIYDARGVRFETQRQGRALNNLNEERKEEGKQPLDIKKFREKLGHTVPEIIAGILLGIVSAIIVFYLPF